MGFIKEGRKRRREKAKEPVQESVRVRKRRREPSEEEIEKPIPNFKLMISTKKELPPATGNDVLVFGPVTGFFVTTSGNLLEHIKYDSSVGLKIRFTHWYPLDRM